MADSTLSSLTAASALDGTELYYSVQGGADRKVTGAQIKTLTSNAPTLVTPVLGVATATSINKVAITAPASGATLTIPDGVTLTGPAASGTAMTLGNAETVTGAKTFNDAKLLLAGSSSGTTTLKATAAASGTITLPAATDTLVGKATTDTLTNKTFDTAGTGNSFSINGTAITDKTGTGKAVLDTSPTLVTPNIGVATGTSLTASGVLASGTNSGTNGQLKLYGSTSGDVTVKAAAAAGTATVFQLPASNGTAGQLLKTDGSGVTSWVSAAGTGDMLAANNLSDVASATTSATNLGLGTGNSPQFTAVNIGHASDTTVSRASAGVIAVEGVSLYPNIPINSQSAAYTAVLGDANTCIYHPNSDNNARTFTIPANASVAYPVGTFLTFINDKNTVTIAITTDTLVLANTAGATTGSRTLADGGMATAVKVTSTRWIISGTGLT